MKFELVSDLHLEFIYDKLDNPKAYLEKIFSKPKAETLLIAGDTASHLAEPNIGIVDFFKLVSNRYKRVISVLGNHDYINDLSPLEIVPKAVTDVLPEAIWLNNETLDLGDVVIFGGTLWSEISEFNKVLLANYMIDYRMITKMDESLLTPDDTNRLNKESFAALQSAIESSSKPLVVMTHHAPCMISSKWPNSNTTEGFCNRYDGFLKLQKKLKLWVHGHVHQPVDYKCGNVRVVAHPHGYINYERFPDSDYKPLLLNL